MNRDIFDVFDEMFEEIKTEVDRVKSFEPLDWGRGVAYETAWGMFHRFNGAVTFAYQTGSISFSEFLEYSNQSENLIRSLYKQ